jgi:transposase
MALHGGDSARVQAIVDAALRGELSEEQARELQRIGGSEAVLFALLAAARKIAQLHTKADRQPPDPATPSAMVPVHQKPTTRKRRQKPGAKIGHPGSRRPAPEKIDQRKEHRLDRCPDCGGTLQRCRRSRTRVIEDIPETIEPIIVEHTIHRDYCPACRKHVEPVVPDALPRATVGHHLVALTAWLHYGLGVTIEKVVSILSHHLHTRLTSGGLMAVWVRTAAVLISWYEQIGLEARRASWLHCDETGWRVAGKTHWLWCFTTSDACCYIIDRSRGSPALHRFFSESFRGVLIHDFWAAYESVWADDRQYCLVHLLRELEKVDQTNHSLEWRHFAKKLRRLIRDAIRLRKRTDFSPETYRSRIHLIDSRLNALAWASYTDSDARRVGKRLDRHLDQLFTFLDHPEIPWENNLAERMLRPAVIMRKTSQSNRSEQGAAVQSILMSIYQTLRLRGHSPTKTIAAALKTYTATGQLPPLPEAIVADG